MMEQKVSGKYAYVPDVSLFFENQKEKYDLLDILRGTKAEVFDGKMTETYFYYKKKDINGK